MSDKQWAQMTHLEKLSTLKQDGFDACENLNGSLATRFMLGLGYVIGTSIFYEENIKLREENRKLSEQLGIVDMSEIDTEGTSEYGPYK